MAITNNSRGARGFNERVGEGNGDGEPAQAVRHLMPGESADFVLHDPANPIYKAWADAGEVDFGGALDVSAETPRRGRRNADASE